MIIRKVFAALVLDAAALLARLAALVRSGARADAAKRLLALARGLRRLAQLVASVVHDRGLLFFFLSPL